MQEDPNLVFEKISIWTIFKNWIRRRWSGDTQVSFRNAVRANSALENKDADAFVQALLLQSVKDRIARGESAPKLPR